MLSRLAFTLLPALGWLPETRAGGQVAAQSPVQVLALLVSSLPVYNVIPFESTRIVPSFLFLAVFKASVLTGAWAAEAATVAAGAAWVAEGAAGVGVGESITGVGVNEGAGVGVNVSPPPVSGIRLPGMVGEGATAAGACKGKQAVRSMVRTIKNAPTLRCRKVSYKKTFGPKFCAKFPGF